MEGNLEGIIKSFRRGISSQRSNQMVIVINNINTRKQAFALVGKKVVWNSKTKKITGKISNAHGNNGAVRARFNKPLPAQSIGSKVLIL